MGCRKHCCVREGLLDTLSIHVKGNILQHKPGRDVFRLREYLTLVKKQKRVRHFERPVGRNHQLAALIYVKEQGYCCWCGLPPGHPCQRDRSIRHECTRH